VETILSTHALNTHKVKCLVCYPGGTSSSTRSPFVILLFRRAQSGRWSSYRETGVVHRITFSFSDFLFYLCFIYSFYSWYKTMECYIQLNN